MSSKVRFAPSPTGYLHIGGARTALFNWLFIKNKKGKFVLRIEDTDNIRSSKEMSKEIINAMKWLELNWDEGPYYQSERLSVYKEYAERLLSEGKAYRCFCTAEEIEERRKEAEKKGVKSWKYDRKCLSLSQEEIEKNLEEKKPFVIRFKVPEGKTEFKDKIHKKISVNNSEIEDFVLLKSDGFPTYHLSVVVDDHLMGITDVIRGDDHLSNTPKQILLYKAFGWKIPEFAHLPLILGPDKQKLSKRHGVTSVLNYKKEGYLSLSLINFLARLSWNPGDDKPFFTREELINRFNLSKITKNSPVFDVKKLDFINSKVISSLEAEKIYSEIISITKDEIELNFLKTNKEKVLKAIDLLKSRMKNLKDFAKILKNYINEIESYDKEGEDKFFNKNGAEYLKSFLEDLKKIREEEFNEETLEVVLRKRAEKIGIKAGEIIHPLRLALTGNKVSPGIFEVLTFFGKEESIKRIEKAIEYINEKDSTHDSRL